MVVGKVGGGNEWTFLHKSVGTLDRRPAVIKAISPGHTNTTGTELGWEKKEERKW